jgi:IS1 family transposase
MRPHFRKIQPPPFDVNTSVHRFEELIAGKPYSIEVAAVSKDRWRAYIVRLPGVPTAVMPFYGPTPDEAAGLLRQWLTRAHARATNGVPRV